jgi:hypothetical protein
MNDSSSSAELVALLAERDPPRLTRLVPPPAS